MDGPVSNFAYNFNLRRYTVFFCTYPELYGNLPAPGAPQAARLRWGEKCRVSLWGNWTGCSMRCGEGYIVGRCRLPL